MHPNVYFICNQGKCQMIWQIFTVALYAFITATSWYGK
jgi:hypothetical protein